ncbi:MAG: NUDIX hydrolase [Syntrophales bacterium]|jgi:ADP-ribose pyrophosphatase|nr:NUDIX hydrolase [Syntrophales bacterium]NLN59826.1 NUDIX hydrolase [Deltaproteobacteria bacterium]
MSDYHIKEKQVYQCRIFSVYEGEYRLPDGRVNRQTRVEHKPCVAVVPVDDLGRILLIKQYRYAVNQDLLEIPAGSMDKGGESPEMSARRELAEETGYDAANWMPLFEGYLLPGYCNEYMYFFLATRLFPAPLPPDDDECIEVLPVLPEEAMAMIKRGDIIDAKTALGICMARKYLAGHFV